MSDDAIVLLKDDHQQLRRALRAFARTREVDTARRGEIRDEVVHLWTGHLEADDEVMYPHVQERVPGLAHDVLVARERNGLTERLVTELARLEPYDERLAAKMRVLAELTDCHVEQDEQELFPQVRQELGRNDLQAVGREIRSRRESSASPLDPDPVSHLVRSVMG